MDLTSIVFHLFFGFLTVYLCAHIIKQTRLSREKDEFFLAMSRYDLEKAVKLLSVLLRDHHNVLLKFSTQEVQALLNLQGADEQLKVTRMLLELYCEKYLEAWHKDFSIAGVNFTGSELTFSALKIEKNR